MAIANYSSNTKIPTNMPWHYNDVKYTSREHAFTAGKWLPVYFMDLFPFSVAFFFSILARQLFTDEEEMLVFMKTSSNGHIYSPHKGQWRGVLMFSLVCAWINCWVNNDEAGDLRRYRGYYDVSVMTPQCDWLLLPELVRLWVPEASHSHDEVWQPCLSKICKCVLVKTSKYFYQSTVCSAVCSQNTSKTETNAPRCWHIVRGTTCER